jgi:hypothetical protein
MDGDVVQLPNSLGKIEFPRELNVAILKHCYGHSLHLRSFMAESFRKKDDI